MYFGLGWSVSALAQVVRFDLDSPLATEGSAEVQGSWVELSPYGSGAAWVDAPVTLPPTGGFRAAFEVALREGQAFGGGGITFTLQGEGSSALGGGDQGLGYEGIAPSLAVELDPWRSDGVADPDGNHVGIDLNGSVDSAVSRSVPFDLEHDDRSVFGWVDYDGAVLTVSLSDRDERTAPLVVFPVAASVVPSPLWVGFTASSGEFDAERSLLAFTFVADGDSDGDGALDFEDDAPEAPAASDPEADYSELPPLFFCGCAAGRSPPAGASLALALVWLARRSRWR